MLVVSLLSKSQAGVTVVILGSFEIGGNDFSRRSGHMRHLSAV